MSGGAPETVLRTGVVSGSTNGNGPNIVTTLVAGAIALFLHLSFLVSQLFGTAYHPVDIRIRITVALVVTAALLALWARRRSASDSLPALAFACVVMPFWLTFWISEAYHVAIGRFEQPFVGPKLMFFVISALCPTRPRWMAPALLASMCIEVAIMWKLLGFATEPTVVATGEPWISVSYALLAFFLFASRVHWMHLHEELARARAETRMLHTTNQAFVAVQDLANTPLQSLEIALSLMERERPEDSLVRSAKRAVQRLRVLTRHLPVEQRPHSNVDTSALEEIRTRRNGNGERHRDSS